MSSARKTDQTVGRQSAIRIALLLLCAAASGAALADSPQAAAAVGGVRPANPDPNQRSMNVSLADLDLTSAAGARTAQERLHQAARRLCFELADSEDLGHQPHFVQCVEQATASALRQLALPALVASGKEVGP
jgi:UrcA family protein